MNLILNKCSFGRPDLSKMRPAPSNPAAPCTRLHTLFKIDSMQLLPYFQGLSKGECCYAGAVLSRVLYSPNEPWSFANVATLAGIHQGVPVPLNSSVTIPATPLYGFSVFQDLPVAFDVHSQWADAPTATAWGISNLHLLCNETASLVVLQVLF